MPVSIRGRISRLLGPMAQKGVFSLADQVTVSGASFATTIMIGRICGPGELAIYALGFSLVIIIRSVLQTLITLPYTIYSHRMNEREAAEYRGVIILESCALSIVAALVLAVWGILIESGPAPILLVLSGTIPFLIFRELGRQLAFAHLQPKNALWLDSAAAIQLTGLIVLSAGGWLSAISATVNTSIANGVMAVAWFILSFRTFAIRWNRVWSLAKRNWVFGRWVLAIRMISHLNSDIFILWLLSFALGDEATGIFAACMTVIHLSNPFIMGMGQILTPKISQLSAQSRPDEIHRIVHKTSIFMGSVLGLFSLGVFLFGNRIMKILYGDTYGAQTTTLTILSFSVLVLAVGIPSLNGLWAYARTRTTFITSLIGLMFTAPLAFILVHSLGLPGVALALTLGITIRSLSNWILFRVLVRDEATSSHH